MSKSLDCGGSRQLESKARKSRARLKKKIQRRRNDSSNQSSKLQLAEEHKMPLSKDSKSQESLSPEKTLNLAAVLANLSLDNVRSKSGNLLSNRISFSINVDGNEADTEIESDFESEDSDFDDVSNEIQNNVNANSNALRRSPAFFDLRNLRQ